MFLTTERAVVKNNNRDHGFGQKQNDRLFLTTERAVVKNNNRDHGFGQKQNDRLFLTTERAVVKNNNDFGQYMLYPVLLLNLVTHFILLLFVNCSSIAPVGMIWTCLKAAFQCCVFLRTFYV